jgi:phospholipid/cholesterol/gamma-HCH transport system substrate-binding protein
MKAATNKRTVIVGIFIFLGIAIFVIAILTLGGQQKTFKKAITIKAVFGDVQGLQKGNNVWFSGVKIGTVKRISFIGNSNVEVDINIEEKSKEFIRKNATAKIGSEGFIGNKLVEISGGTQQAAAVEDGDMLKVIESVSTEQMMGTFQASNKNLLEITTDLKVVSTRLQNGQGTLGKLLTDEAIVNELSAVLAALHRASVNAERITNTVAGYASELHNKGSLANELVNDTVVYARLRATATQLEAMSRSTMGVVQDLKNASTTINNGISNPNSPVGTLLTDEAAANDIKVILRNLNSGTKKLDEDLEAIQHNFLLRGFFKKKAKREAEAKKGETEKGG